MIIESLELKNFRQYRNQKILFAGGEDDKRITVIQGANGAGKTNLLNAITWCLFDEERHLGDAERGLPIVNNICLNELEEEEVCHVKIELVLKLQNHHKMIVRRIVFFKKTGENEVEGVGQHKFEVLYQENNDIKPAPDPELTINQHLPKDIQEYFFFHCERLDDYFKGTSNTRLIRKEVFKISQLELFENVLSHLKNRNDEYSKELKKINPKADHIKHLIDEKRREQKEYEKDLETFLEEEKEATKLEKELEKDLRDYPSSKEIKDLQQKRVKLEERGNQLERELEEISVEHKEFLITAAPLLLAHEALSFMEDNISIKDAAGLIPPPYRRSFLNELLERGYCICDTKFSNDKEAEKRIKELFSECDVVTDISDELSVDLKNLELMKNAAQLFHKKHVSYAKRINGIHDDLREISIEEKKISEKLQNVDDEKISNWENQLQIIKKKKTDAIEHRARRKQQIEDLKIECAKLTKEYENELKKIDKHTELTKRLLFCSKAMEAARDIKDEIMDEIRNEVEELTRRQFFDLIWKKDNFKSVRISEDYDISVLDQNGVEVIGTLSDGERQVLALSFIAALNIISGFNAPIMIDTPLGRISKEPKSNIAGKLPNYLKEKQLTLLVTEEEYTQEVRNRMRAYVGREYKINFRETELGNEAEVTKYET
ncbi:AAA family ATPase [candidate division KSB3 bacterium]|nr:AAA family ATPase [candidate division KSB3 bacterium]